MKHCVWVLGAALFGLVGCAHQQMRLQSADEADRDKEAEIKTIGEVTDVANAQAIPVSGVGLVVGLDGTGGGAPPGGYRDMLERELLKRKIPNVKEVLSSPNTSLVLVSALIPPGARKGDCIDVQISLPAESRTTSLRGGRLIECDLKNFSTANALDPEFKIHSAGNDKLFSGHPLAHAAGPLLVGFGDGDEAARLRRARIYGGGRCRQDRPFFLALNSDQQYARVAMRVAERVNETFQGPFVGMQTIAEAKTKQAVVLAVPQQYRHNLPRYLRVVRLIPLQESPSPASPYRRRLERELLDPAHAVTAALRLEALGSNSIPLLKKGLQSEHTLVRFASAEALAYLGSPACGEELAQLAEQQPMLRAYCLTAMASLDEAVCHVKLRDLLASPSAETRYGAFRALRALDEREPAAQGEILNESFWLHHVAPESSPLVHISTSRRAEIVLYGDGMMLRPPFSFLAGSEYTVTAGKNDDRCTIRRISLHKRPPPKQCSFKIDDVLHMLAELGASYSDVVELIRQADQCKCLGCPVAVDALPQAVPVQTLAKAGAAAARLEELHPEIAEARAELGATPTLFDEGQPGGPGERSETADKAALLRDKEKDGKQRVERAPWKGHLVH